jgi:Fe-Mn family superoxide dismutase
MTYSKEANQAKAPFILPDLPYDKTALNPHMSAETFDYHHGKHHNAYVTNLNKLLESTLDLSSKNLEEIILASHGNSSFTGVFNNAAQVWNHTFFWHSMKQNGGGKPSGKVLEHIEKDFGTFEKFVEEFKQAGATQFGSGWAWLVYDGSKLKVVKTANADTPITSGLHPLICCDVWEHAYYIDYRNKRPDFIAAFLEHLVNWDFAAKNLK